MYTYVYIVVVLLSLSWYNITFQEFMTPLRQNAVTHTQNNIVLGPEYNSIFEG